METLVEIYHPFLLALCNISDPSSFINQKSAIGAVPLGDYSP
jgi:hypothetical protein